MLDPAIRHAARSVDRVKQPEFGNFPGKTHVEFRGGGAEAPGQRDVWPEGPVVVRAVNRVTNARYQLTQGRRGAFRAEPDDPWAAPLTASVDHKIKLHG